METAGAEETPDDAERKGLGTPATRAATLEKLVQTGFVQRKKKQLIPTEKGVNLIAVLPEKIKSPLLTAQWESMLKQVERGEVSADSFMDGIADMSRELVKTNTAPDKHFLSLFPKKDGGEAIGTCPAAVMQLRSGKRASSVKNRTANLPSGKTISFLPPRKRQLQNLLLRLS